MKKIADFEIGVLYSAAVLQSLHGETSLAASLLNEAGLTHADCLELDECDKKALRAICKIEKNINLKGLD